MTRQEIEGRRNVLSSLILEKEAKLRETDYVAAKIAEGAATPEEYAEVLAERRKARKEINDAQAEIAELENVLIDEEEAHHEEDFR